MALSAARNERGIIVYMMHLYTNMFTYVSELFYRVLTNSILQNYDFLCSQFSTDFGLFNVIGNGPFIHK